jgi:hypothetical protein
MRLTLEQLEDAFSKSEYEGFFFSTFWVLISHVKKYGDVDLREALELVRAQEYEVTVFIEQILQKSDLDDVECVIEKLVSDTDYQFFQAGTCLKMLQSWRARTLMRIAIEKQKAMNLAVFDLEQEIL